MKTKSCGRNRVKTGKATLAVKMAGKFIFAYHQYKSLNERLAQHFQPQEKSREKFLSVGNGCIPRYLIIVAQG